MRPEVRAALEDCIAGPHEEHLHFPPVATRHRAVGVERYRVDLCLGEIVYHLGDGESVTLLGDPAGRRQPAPLRRSKPGRSATTSSAVWCCWPAAQAGRSPCLAAGWSILDGPARPMWSCSRPRHKCLGHDAVPRGEATRQSTAENIPVSPYRIAHSCVATQLVARLTLQAYAAA